MSKIEEEWRDIKGYEGLYQVSDRGRVKALAKNKKGIGKNQFDDEHLLKIHYTSPNGGKKRCQVSLYKHGVKKFLALSRLVYEAFKGEIPEGLQVNHIDEDPTNNHLWNLNLMTPKENTNWATCIERRIKSFKENGKLSKPVQQFKNGVLIAEYPSAKEASRKTGLPQSNISRCCNGGFLWRGKWINVFITKGYVFKYKNEQPN